MADVIFGEKGDSVLLGAFTLEALGLSLELYRSMEMTFWLDHAEAEVHRLAI